MNFNFNLKDASTKNKLREMLQDLYPEYNYIRIRKNGEIIMKKNWWSLRSDRISSFKLCTDPELLPLRISQYAQSILSGEYDLQKILKYIISVRNNEFYPIIDKLYLEYISIKYSNIWHMNNMQIELPTDVTMSQLIVISKKPKLSNICYGDINNVTRLFRKRLTKNRYLPVTTISQ